nr:IclR family transcriptional regulator [uncultured Holophaga sp.]
MAEKRARSPYGIQSLSQAIGILLLLHRHPEGLSSQELAALQGLPPETATQIAHALKSAGMLQGDDLFGYQLGPSLLKMAMAVRPQDLLQTARPLLHQLTAATGETASLVALVQGRPMVMEVSRGASLLQAVPLVGSPVPFHGTSAGKALLAALPEDELSALREEGPGLLYPWTGRTRCDWPGLDAELDFVRESGIAYDHGEYLEGISSIATLMPMPGPTLTAMTVTVPSSRFHQVEDLVVSTLRECRANLVKRWETPHGLGPSLQEGLAALGA